MNPDDASDGGEALAIVSGLRRLRRFTPARIGLGHAGSGVPTAESLKFMLDHAEARDAVHVALDFEALAKALGERGWTPVLVRSAVGGRAEYLRRPDLGRRLSPAGRATIASQPRGCDVAVIAADGLSSTAIEASLRPVLNSLRPFVLQRRLTLAPLVLVEHGRVAIGDEIGELLDAKLAIVLIGERPGLSAADSLGAYVTWYPRVGTMDSGRNCISNIRATGLPPEEGARQIDELVGLAFMHAATGVRLNDSRAALALRSDR